MSGADKAPTSDTSRRSNDDTPAPDWVRPHALAYYEPRSGSGTWYAATCDSAPRRLGDQWVVRLRDVDPIYGKECHGDASRTSVAAAHVGALRPRGVYSARETLREVMACASKPAAPRSIVGSASERLYGASREQPTKTPIDVGGSTRTRPRVVTLCGSTRFYKEFTAANYRLTMAGVIVLSVGFVHHAAAEAHGQNIGCSEEQKKELDALHLRKIDMSDAIHVLNVDGYIGSSTQSELAHAIATGKGVTFLEPDAGELYMREHAHELGALVSRHMEGAR